MQPPHGTIEVDLCQADADRPRLSVRERNGSYEVYTRGLDGVEYIDYTSPDFQDAYRAARTLLRWF